MPVHPEYKGWLRPWPLLLQVNCDQIHVLMDSVIVVLPIIRNEDNGPACYNLAPDMRSR